MGYFLENTVEIEIDGEIQRVFYLEAEAIKAKLVKEGKKVKIKEEPQKQKPNPQV